MIVLQTERLILRELTTNDAEFILKLLNEPSFLRYIGDKGVRTIEDAYEYILNNYISSYKNNGFGFYLVELKEGNVSIGLCGLVKRPSLTHPDVGFAFLPDYWSKGYAVESASAVIAYGQDTLGLTCILGITSIDNHSSMNVLKKIGLKFEKRIKLFENEPELNLFKLGNS